MTLVSRSHDPNDHVRHTSYYEYIEWYQSSNTKLYVFVTINQSFPFMCLIFEYLRSTTIDGVCTCIIFPSINLFFQDIYKVKMD